MSKSSNSVSAAKGKYVAKARHFQTISFEKMAEKIAYNCTLTKADIMATLIAFGDEMKKQLQEGNMVEMPNIGKFKIEMEVSPVSSPSEFEPSKHLKRYQVHVLPAMKDGKRDLYQGIQLEKE